MLPRRMGISTFLAKAYMPKSKNSNLKKNLEELWLMIGEKMLSLSQKKEAVNMTRHLQVDLLMPDLLVLISAVLFHFFFI